MMMMMMVMMVNDDNDGEMVMVWCGDDRDVRALDGVEHGAGRTQRLAQKTR